MASSAGRSTPPFLYFHTCRLYLPEAPERRPRANSRRSAASRVAAGRRRDVGYDAGRGPVRYSISVARATAPSGLISESPIAPPLHSRIWTMSTAAGVEEVDDLNLHGLRAPYVRRRVSGERNGDPRCDHRVGWSDFPQRSMTRRGKARLLAPPPTERPMQTGALTNPALA